MMKFSAPENSELVTAWLSSDLYPQKTKKKFMILTGHKTKQNKTKCFSVLFYRKLMRAVDSFYRKIEE